MTDYEEILKLKELKNARVIGGKGGLDQPISWIHIVYDVNIGPWIGPSNLVYTNGSGLQYPEQDLLSILKQLKEANAAGIMVERGKFINVISPKVIQLADKLDLPLIEIVGEVNITSITHAIAYLCFENEKRLQQEELLKKLIYFPSTIEHGKDYEKLLSRLKFPNIAVAFQLDTIPPQHSIERISKTMLNYLRDAFSIPEEFLLHFEKDQNHICLLPLCYVKDSLLYGLNQARTQLEYQTGVTTCIGCGTVISDISQISVSVYQAVCAIESLHLCKRSNEVMLYENMGIYRIFFQYQNDQELINLYHSILGKLVSYDTENNSQLLETLEMYFAQNGNLTVTADALFIHKNTLKYRLNRIKEILNIDFDAPNPGFTVQLALKIKHYMISKGITL